MSQPLSDYDKINSYLAANMPGESKEKQAAALGVTRATLYNWRDGVYEPGLDWMQRNATREDWVGELCRELLASRGLVVATKCGELP